MRGQRRKVKNDVRLSRLKESARQMAGIDRRRFKDIYVVFCVDINLSRDIRSTPGLLCSTATPGVARALRLA